MPVTVASKQDIPAIIILLNSAYRGDESRKGWTTEAGLVDGEIRTDIKNMNELMDLPDSVFLKHTNQNNDIEGCVYLSKKGEKLYLGMLSVIPGLQSKGLGKQLMKAAELYAIKLNCKSIFMRVISARKELITWYENQGYYLTGEKQPFPDGLYGTSKIPIEFVVLQKKL